MRIKPLKKGEGPTLLDTDKGNELIYEVSAISSMTVLPSGSGKFVISGSGVATNCVLQLNLSNLGSGGLHPLMLVDASDYSDPDFTIYKIRVIYGTIAGEAPTGMSPGDNPAYMLSVSDASGVVYGGVTRSGKDITSRFIDHASSIPGNTSENGYFEIGSWSIDSDGGLNIAQSVSGSQAWQYCGGSHLWGLV